MVGVERAVRTRGTVGGEGIFLFRICKQSVKERWRGGGRNP